MVGVGQRCVVRVRIADIELRNARGIKATIVSPQGEEKCQDVSFDELESVAYVSTAVDSVGSWSMWLGVRFEEEAIYTPAFVFAEVDGEAKPCDAPYVVDVDVAGESVTVTPPHIDVDGGGDVSREEFDALAKDVADLAEQSKEFMPATPSGDPMHYAYEAAGAVWNGDTGYWELNRDQGGLVNITTTDMRVMYNEYSASWTNAMDGLFAYSKSRTNLLGQLVDVGWGYITNSTNYMYLDARNMEIAYLAEYASATFTLTNAHGMFFRAHKLKKIIGVLDFSSATYVSEMFVQCYALENVRCANLKQGISFADSPLLSKESLLYMIDNCASGVSFTITLHPDVYDNAKDSWATEIEYAIEIASSNKGTTITLASA